MKTYLSSPIVKLPISYLYKPFKPKEKPNKTLSSRKIRNNQDRWNITSLKKKGSDFINQPSNIPKPKVSKKQVFFHITTYQKLEIERQTWWSLALRTDPEHNNIRDQQILIINNMSPCICPINTKMQTTFHSFPFQLFVKNFKHLEN